MDEETILIDDTDFYNQLNKLSEKNKKYYNKIIDKIKEN